MNTIELTNHTGDWHTIVAAIESSGEAAAIALDGVICGMLLPSQAALRIAAHYQSAAPSLLPDAPHAQSFEPRNYLELLRDDPNLVPLLDGQPLEFVTMMNSSFVDPQQIYQFKHPVTRQIYFYRADQLRQAINRMFVSVDFIPTRPKDFVANKR